MNKGKTAKNKKQTRKAVLTPEELKRLKATKTVRGTWTEFELDKLKYAKYEIEARPIDIHHAGILPNKSYHSIVYMYQQV